MATKFSSLMRGVPLPDEYEQNVEIAEGEPQAEQMSLDQFNRSQLRTAIYCDYQVKVQFQMPLMAKAQFQVGAALDAVEDDGGTVEPMRLSVVGYFPDGLVVMQEARKLSKMYWPFYDKYGQDGVVYVDPETNPKRYAILHIEMPAELKPQEEEKKVMEEKPQPSPAEEEGEPHGTPTETEEEEEKPEEENGEEERQAHPAHHGARPTSTSKRKKK